MSAKKKPANRHGQLADNRTQTSITIEKELLARLRSVAKNDGRSLSNWMEQTLKKTLDQP